MRPAFGCPEFSREARRIPLSAARKPQSVYTPMMTLSVLMPASRAASRFPPTA